MNLYTSCLDPGAGRVSAIATLSAGLRIATMSGIAFAFCPRALARLRFGLAGSDRAHGARICSTGGLDRGGMS